MKVNIGNYVNYITTYDIAKTIFFWAKTTDEYGFETPSQWVYDVGEWLAHGSVDRSNKSMFADNRPQTWLSKFLKWVNGNNKRKISVKIEPHDTWGGYHTLALVILPFLKSLDKMGCPLVEQEHLPEHLRYTSGEALYFSNHDAKEKMVLNEPYNIIEEKMKNQWEYIYSEMVWAFEQIVNEKEISADNFYIEGTQENHEWKDTDGNIIHSFTTPQVDWDAYKANQQRIKNGLMLFGYYFQSLWE